MLISNPIAVLKKKNIYPQNLVQTSSARGVFKTLTSIHNSIFAKIVMILTKEAS